MADYENDYFNPLLSEVVGQSNLLDIRSFEQAITANNWKEVKDKLKKEGLNKVVKDYYQGLMALHNLEKEEEELKAQAKPPVANKQAKKETSFFGKAAELVSEFAGQVKETATQAVKAVGMVAEEKPLTDQINAKSSAIAAKLETQEKDKDAAIKKYLQARLYSRVFFSDFTDHVFRLNPGSSGYSRSRTNEVDNLIKELESKASLLNRWGYRISQAWKAFKNLFRSKTLVRENKPDVAPKPEDVVEALQEQSNKHKFKTSDQFREKNNAVAIPEVNVNDNKADEVQESAVVEEKRTLTPEEQAVYTEQFARRAKIKSAETLPLIEKVRRQAVIHMRNTLMEYHNQLVRKKAADILSPIVDLVSNESDEIKNTYAIEGKPNVFENIDVYADKFAQANNESLAAIQDEEVKKKALNMAGVIKSLNAILANEDKNDRLISPKTLAEFKTLLASPHIKQLDKELKDFIQEVAAELAKLENPAPAVSPALSHPVTAEPAVPVEAPDADKAMEHTSSKKDEIEAAKHEEFVSAKEPVDTNVIESAKRLEKDLKVLHDYIKDHHKDISTARIENFTALLGDLNLLLKKEPIKSEQLTALIQDHLKKDNNVEDKIAKTSVRGALITCLAELTVSVSARPKP